MATTNWQVGQEVFYYEPNLARYARGRDEAYEPRRVVIEKVGTKLVHTSHGSFYRDTGYGRDSYSTSERIFTPEQWAEQAEREAVLKRLRDHDAAMWRIADKLELATLKGILELIEKDLAS